MPAERTTEWWLAVKEPPHGLIALEDGPHEDMAGVAHALYLHGALGLTGKREYVCAEIRLHDVEPAAKGEMNNDAVQVMRTVMQARQS